MSPWSRQLRIYRVLKKIEKGILKIKCINHDDTSWVGKRVYWVSNGYIIIVFNDVYCFDYIEKVVDNNGFDLYSYSEDAGNNKADGPMPLIENYFPTEFDEKYIWGIDDGLPI